MLATTVQLLGKIFFRRLVQKFFSSDNFNSKYARVYLNFTFLRNVPDCRCVCCMVFRVPVHLIIMYLL